MASSQTHNLSFPDPLDSVFPSRSCGVLGVFDAGDPSTPALIGDTPGPAGILDHGDVYSQECALATPLFHFTVQPDPQGFYWDYDPKHLLDNDELNPQFVELAHRALAYAISQNFRPRIGEAYRSIERSNELFSIYQQRGSRAAPAWQSVHNYGLAMDIQLFDAKKKYLTSSDSYGPLQDLLQSFGFSGGIPDDMGHVEYHPNWKEVAAGSLLTKTRKWALDAANWPNANAGTYLVAQISYSVDPWLNYFWWAAGAGGLMPAADFLAKNPCPTQ